ncbi:MAG: hypothetical protein Q7T55_19900 [Solirubrobacteraceae bacterium]|nr:hypothetical protein [Solirubrobacteraceae bacterium]
MTNQTAARQALERRQKVARPVTAPAAAAAAPASPPEATTPPATKPAGARAARASSSKPKAPVKAASPKRPAGTRRVTLDADAAALQGFQDRLDNHGWTQRAGLTAAVNLFNGLADEEFDRLCRQAQIDAKRR